MIDQIKQKGKAPLTMTPSTQIERSYNFEPPESAKPFLDSITTAEGKYGLPKNLLPVLINTESNFNPEARSHAGAIGIAQIVPKWHPTVDPTDPHASIDYSAKHLRELYDRFGDWDQAIAAYNTGASNVKKLWPDKLPKETQDYLKKINQFAEPGRKVGQKSMLDQIKKAVESKQPDTPVTDIQTPERQKELANVKPNEVREFYNSTAGSPYGLWSPAISAAVGKMGFGPKPEGGWDEFGRPLDDKGKPYIEQRQIKPDKVQEAVGDTLSGLAGFVTDPYETARGIFDFGLSIPAFMVGMVGAAARGSKALVDEIVGSDDFSLDNIYNSMAKGMQESFEFFQPGKEALVGAPTEKSQRVGEVAMAPLTAFTELAHIAANDPFYEDSPNIRGALKFAGDFVGLATMGIALRGRNRRIEFTKDVEEVVKEATDISKAKKEVEAMPNDVNKAIAQKELEIKKTRLENKANQFAKKFKDDAVIIEEMGRQSEELAKAKLRPVQESGMGKVVTEGTKFEFEFTSKKGNKYYKSGDTWYNEFGSEVTNKHKKGALEKNKKPFEVKEEKPEVKVVKKTPKVETKKEQPKSEPEAKPETEIDWFGEDKVIEVDRKLGEKVPELDDAVSVFNQDAKRTKTLAKIFDERGNRIAGDPEVFMQKLVNDVNRWLHGEEIPIDRVRQALSDMATRSEDLRGQFMTGRDHLIFTEAVKDAAAWARKTNRSSVRLNMMIPLDEVPNMVKAALKDLFPGAKRIKLGDVYRNKELFRKSGGFWLGRDGKWRFELDDSKAEVDISNIRRSSIDQTGGVGTYKLPQVFKHPSIYEVSPSSKDTILKIDNNLDVAGRAMHSRNTIIVNGKFNNKAIRDILLHEVQHRVNIEAGAFTGSNTNLTKYNTYIEGLESIIPELKPGWKEFVEAGIERVRQGDIGFFENVMAPVLELHKKETGLKPEQYDHIRPLTKEEAHIMYETHPGEMEARLTQYRSELDSRTRRAITPWESLNNMLRDEGHLESSGLKLYSGDPVAELTTKAIMDSVAKVNKYMDKARGYKKLKPREVAKATRTEFNRLFIDRSGNIRRDLIGRLGEEGYKIVQKMYLAKGAPSIASNALKQMQKEVYDGLSSGEKKILDTVILSERMIDIGKYKGPKEFKHPSGLTLDDFIRQRYAFDKFHKLNPERATEIIQRMKAYFEWMKKPLKDMLDAGLISEQEFQDLSTHNYRRIEKVKSAYDRRKHTKIGGKRRSVYDSGVESLQRGKDTDIYEPSSEVMALEVFNRAYGRILNNQANKALLDLARNDPSNPFVRVRSKEQKVPPEWNKLHVFEDGQRKTIHVDPEFSKEWITASPEISYNLSRILKYTSGAPILRMFATGINWGFAVANLPRDVIHTWFTARVFEEGKGWKPIYNPNLPIFGMQIGRDLSTVFYDAATKGKRYQDYINQGGGMEFLTHQGRLFKRGRHLESGVDTLFSTLGYFGETSEVMTRLAIRERVLRKRAKQQGISLEEARNNPDIAREATFAARDYMDFGQGGSVTKALDNGVPYLNAAIQGTRGLYRSLKPGSGSALSSSYKLAQLATVTVGTYLTARAMHPETMKNLEGSVDEINNLVIPLGDQFGFEDEEGQTRYPYIKIPLDPSQKFFSQVFKAGADKWTGREVDVGRLVDTLNEQSPVKVTESLPPTVSGALGYMSNRDFWLNEDIWKGTKKPFDYPESKEEYIPGKTPQFYIDLGQFTGLSPERAKYAVEELLTTGTMWSQLMGEGYDKLFSDLPKSKKEQHLAMVLSKMPVSKRFIGVTHPYSKHAKKVNEAEQRSVLKKFVENRGVDSLVERYLYEGTAERKEIIDYAMSFKDKDTYDRLIDRFKWEEAIKTLPEKSFWRRMKGMNTDARAELFVNRLNQSNDEERRQLWQEYSIVNRAGGVVSEDFRKQVLRTLK